MSEAIWIELIKVLPTLLWVGLAVAALVIARNLLVKQAHRLTRVESPFVSVDFAQDAIEQAENRGPESAPLTADDALSVDESLWRKELVPEPWNGGSLLGAGAPAPRAEERPAPADDEHADPDKTHSLRPATPAPDTDEDEAVPDGGDGVQTAPAAIPDGPRPNATPPATGAVGYPPPIKAKHHFAPGYPLQPNLPSGTSAVRPPSYYTSTTDPQANLRAASRLASAADLLQGGRILWVDDHHKWNEPLIRLFRTAGMIVDLASGTDEALRLLDRAGYDLVITDLHREHDPGDQTAGMVMLDGMVDRGVPTPAIVFSDNPHVRRLSHPRAAAATNSPGDVVNLVVDLVGHRRNTQHQQQGLFHFGGL